MNSRELRLEVVKRIKDSIHKELGWDGTIVTFSPIINTRYCIGVSYLPTYVYEVYNFPLDTTADAMVASVMLSLTFR